jgi:hypothetical protein
MESPLDGKGVKLAEAIGINNIRNESEAGEARKRG